MWWKNKINKSKRIIDHHSSILDFILWSYLITFYVNQDVMVLSKSKTRCTLSKYPSKFVEICQCSKTIQTRTNFNRTAIYFGSYSRKGDLKNYRSDKLHSNHCWWLMLSSMAIETRLWEIIGRWLWLRSSRFSTYLYHYC